MAPPFFVTFKEAHKAYSSIYFIFPLLLSSDFPDCHFNSPFNKIIDGTLWVSLSAIKRIQNTQESIGKEAV